MRDEFVGGWRQSGVTVISTTFGRLGMPSFSFPATLNDLALWQSLFDCFPDIFIKVISSRDIERAHREGKLGVILNFQNTIALDGDLERLDLFYRLGVRIIQLTYNSRNLVGDGCPERTSAGLSEFGVRLVKRMNALGIMIDLFHCGDGTVSDALEVSEASVVFTHTFARTLHNHPRGKTDEQLMVVARKGGYIGVVAVPFFLSLKRRWGRSTSLPT